MIDVGNTSTAVGLWSDGRVSNVTHIDGSTELALENSARLADRVEGLAYVSVVPKKDRMWRLHAERLGLKFHQVSCDDFAADAPGGLRLDYPEPATIGADRLADAAGAVARYGAPVMVLDFGTAFTAAVITGDKIWRGGVIAPGFPLMRDYLFERTAKLPRLDIGGGEIPVIGRSTEEAMRFGALVGYRGMVREIIAELRRGFNENFRLVATGGFSKWVLRNLDCGLETIVDQDLTLYGTGLICANSL